MRCEECLTLVEEYFDGELERRQSERVSAHLTACESCAAALDALAFEQEMYLRYDRELEVSPALWQHVSAGVARLEETERAAKPLPPLAGLRGRLASAFRSFAPRAAFAPALALVLLAAFVGALWLARPRDNGGSTQVAERPHATGVNQGSAPQAPEAPGRPAEVNPGPEAGTRGPAPVAVEGHGPVEVAIVNAGAVRTAAPERARPGRDALTPPPDENHLKPSEVERYLDGRSPAADVTDGVLATVGTRLPSPEEKEMARHLEQAQSMLRSFQHEAEAEGADAVQIAYERRLSRKLLAENETLRIEAEAAGDKATRQVLDSLEPFLLDIANLRDNASRAEVRSINERMQKKEIIAALHVY